MEKKPPLVMTPFDESLTNDFLQLVKIILPYLPDHVQRIAGIYVKLTELMNAFYCFQPPYYHNRRGRLRKQEKDPGSMFEAVVPYLSPEKREMFDSFSGIWQMMEMMKEMDFGDPANMADMMNIPILGLVENMSYLKCPDCNKEIQVFGESHVEEIAQKHGLNVLAKLPIDPSIAKNCDKGLVELVEGNWLDEAAKTIENLS